MDYCELHLRYPGFKTRAITLSFDDGAGADRKMVETLNRYGLKCTFNLNPGSMKLDPNYVQLDEIRELYRGHEIAAHGFTHPRLHNLDLGGVAYQMVKCREQLEAASGRIVQGFAYPYGLVEAEGLVQCIKNCGIRYARVGGSTGKFELPVDFLRWAPTCHQADARLPELAEAFLKPDDQTRPGRIRPLLMFVWGHSYEFHNKWENLERICQLLAGREAVWYVTNGELIDYLSAFRALRRSANGQIIHNPTDMDIYIRAAGKDIVLPKGETVTIL
jgi:peptidoglycan/xylan/chitin deacetylase (PgdA/CDA1 family)